MLGDVSEVMWYVNETLIGTGENDVHYIIAKLSFANWFNQNCVMLSTLEYVEDKFSVVKLHLIICSRKHNGSMVFSFKICF